MRFEFSYKGGLEFVSDVRTLSFALQFYRDGDDCHQSYGDLFVDFENGKGNELFLTEAQLREKVAGYIDHGMGYLDPRWKEFFNNLASELWSQCERLELERLTPNPDKPTDPTRL